MANLFGCKIVTSYVDCSMTALYGVRTNLVQASVKMVIVFNRKKCTKKGNNVCKVLM